MVTDPADLSDEELKDYLREVFQHTEELNATAIHVHVKNDVVHLTGDVPSEEQRALAELLVLDLVPEDKLINDLVVVPEMSDETPPGNDPESRSSRSATTLPRWSMTTPRKRRRRESHTNRRSPPRPSPGTRGNGE